MVPQQHLVGTRTCKRTHKPIQPPKEIIELSLDKGDSMRKDLPKEKVKVLALPKNISHPPDEAKLDVFRVWLNKGLLKRVVSVYAPIKYYLYLHVEKKYIYLYLLFTIS